MCRSMQLLLGPEDGNRAPWLSNLRTYYSSHSTSNTPNIDNDDFAMARNIFLSCTNNKPREPQSPTPPNEAARDG